MRPPGRRPRGPGVLMPGPAVVGHSIQHNEQQRAFVIDQMLIVCSPTEYRVLTLLLEQVDRCISYAQLMGEDALLSTEIQRRRARFQVMRLVSKVRQKILALGLDIVSVMDTGYILLSSQTAADEGVAEVPGETEAPSERWLPQARRK